MLERRYEQTGEMAELEEAIQIARQAVNLTPTSHPDHADRLSNLGNKVKRRYERTGEMAELEEAIQIARQAVDLAPPGHPDREVCLNNLGNKLERRYERTGEMVYLGEAIQIARQSVHSIPTDHPNRAAGLNNLGNKLERRYERTGEIVDLEEAIKLAKQSVDLAPPGHPYHAGCLQNLGNRLRSRYERTGEMADLVEAIQIARQAVDSTPPSHPDRAGSLNNLGLMLERRYEQTGEMADLEEAIQTARQAVDSTPTSHPDRAGRLNNLGLMLERRYERRGQVAEADLVEAIHIARQVVDSTPTDHPNRALWLNNLGNRLERRYERTEEMADLEEAIQMARQAVDSTPPSHTDRAGRLYNLGKKLQRRYKRTEKMADLKEAIQTATQAVNSIPPEHLDRAGILDNLGLMLETCYERTKEMAALAEAIQIARQAVDSTPPSHPDRAACFTNLGFMLERRYERTGELADLEEASDCLFSAWSCSTAIPFHRVNAAAHCLKLLSLQHRIDSAVQLGKAIIDLLPATHVNLLDRKDKQFVVSMFAGVAADLCSFLLESDQPRTALHYLEQGRTVIVSQLMDLRSDLSTLYSTDPKVAERYETLVSAVNTPLCILKNGAVETQVLKKRRENQDELDMIIRSIRSMAGYERFLLGQTISEMQETASGGSIAIINVTDFRSDAILVSGDAVKSFRLPRLLASEARVWVHKDWTKGKRSQRREKNDEFLTYLSWLWQGCVKQILDEVYTTRHPLEHSLPRVWWIGTGLASSMPFHAAGSHCPGQTENAYNRAISSYTPSIKALAYARSRVKGMETNGTNGTLLLTTMPTTPKGPDCRKPPPDLPGVIEEQEKVVDAASGNLAVTLGSHLNAGQVMETLRDCCIAHFACHGYTDGADPSNSGLILQKSGEGSENGASGHMEQDLLTVRDISGLNLTRARMAYLSACSTAQNKVAKLSDEVIHVVSGFQIAGFPHVVGCLWPSMDWACVEVADRFYSSLLKSGGPDWDSSGVASALREAVMAVRAKEMSMPLTWAQFVHYGV
ncbi:tetratricopeptide-like helical [Fusarium beomiforme]|uniref:Tetratricopeptide-like helical n=1 Tax=Fusarium beomiforme TaxID=44412 RepID=A0A9P5DPY4_9HYPO|nr:tetratricopeptide-like helical [Fusarium beomiforme]